MADTPKTNSILQAAERIDTLLSAARGQLILAARRHLPFESVIAIEQAARPASIDLAGLIGAQAHQYLAVRSLVGKVPRADAPPPSAAAPSPQVPASGARQEAATPSAIPPTGAAPEPQRTAPEEQPAGEPAQASGDDEASAQGLAAAAAIAAAVVAAATSRPAPEASPEASSSAGDVNSSPPGDDDTEPSLSSSEPEDLGAADAESGAEEIGDGGMVAALAAAVAAAGAGAASAALQLDDEPAPEPVQEAPLDLEPVDHERVEEPPAALESLDVEEGALFDVDPGSGRGSQHRAVSRAAPEAMPADVLALVAAAGGDVLPNLDEPDEETSPELLREETDLPASAAGDEEATIQSRPPPAAIRLHPNNKPQKPRRSRGVETNPIPMEEAPASYSQGAPSVGGFDILAEQPIAAEKPSLAPELGGDEHVAPLPAPLIESPPSRVRSSDDVQRIQRFLRSAEEATEKGNLSVAAERYTDALDTDPQHIVAHLGRGRCYLELGDYSAAMSDFRKAEDLDSDSVEPIVAMGDLYFARKEYNRAIECFDGVLERDAGHAMARCRRGISYYYRKNYRQAFLDLQRAYNLDREIPNIKKYVQMAIKKLEREGRR